MDSLQIDTMKSDPELYDNLANSIAPAVFGHREIKRAVLLMLLGGVHKVNPSILPPHRAGVFLREYANMRALIDYAPTASLILMTFYNSSVKVPTQHAILVLGVD